MNRIRQNLGLLIIVLTFLGCGVNDPEIKLEEPMYNWELVGRLSNKEIRDIRVAEDGTIIVSTKNRLYLSEDNGEYFKGYSIPDSVDIYRVRKFENNLYLIGEMYSSHVGGFWGGTIRLLYIMKDENLRWEKMHGGYLFQDIIPGSDKFFVGALNGVTVLGADYSRLERFSLFNSKLNDQVDDMIQFHDYVLLSSHEGVFGSNDQGLTWLDLTARLSKEHDHIMNMRISDSGMLHAMANHRVYTATDNNFEWDIRYLPKSYDAVNMNSDSEYLTLRYDNVYKLNYDELDDRFSSYDITPDVVREVDFRKWELIESLSGGKLILSGTEGVFIGTPNLESEYWNQ
ncbi:MAG: hypothetical protein NXI08_07910 [bacterium]|nr:hypothetical protein [bacterium]